MIDNMRILCAPVQGITDCHWRNAHNDIFGGADGYYGPFMRVEHGGIRKRDIADALPEVVDIEARRVNRLLNAHVLWLIVHQLVFERVISDISRHSLDEPPRNADAVVVALLPD